MRKSKKDTTSLTPRFVGMGSVNLAPITGEKDFDKNLKPVVKVNPNVKRG